MTQLSLWREIEDFEKAVKQKLIKKIVLDAHGGAAEGTLITNLSGEKLLNISEVAIQKSERLSPDERGEQLLMLRLVKMARNCAKCAMSIRTSSSAQHLRQFLADIENMPARELVMSDDDFEVTIRASGSLEELLLVAQGKAPKSEQVLMGDFPRVQETLRSGREKSDQAINDGKEEIATIFDSIGLWHMFYARLLDSMALKRLTDSFAGTGKTSRSQCFIASAACGIDSQEVKTLREFRDRILQNSRIARAFIKIYSRLSPAIAAYVTASPRARWVLRDFLILPIASCVNRHADLSLLAKKGSIAAQKTFQRA